MPSEDERERRKALLRSVKETERKAKAAKLPLPPSQMQALFDFVDERLGNYACDHTLRHTVAFLEAQQLAKDPVLEWLSDAGGYCDCEVIANAEQEFQTSLPRDGKLPRG